MQKIALKDFIKQFSNKRLTTVAGAWVFFFLTSIIPIAFLLATAFGVFGVDLSLELVSRLPEEFRPAGQTIVSTAERASKGATFLFTGAIIFSSSTLINQMSKDGDFIYGQKSARKRGIMRRIWAIIAIFTLFMVFLFVAFLIAFSNSVFTNVNNYSLTKLLITLFAFTIIILLCYFIIIMLNKFISPKKLKFRQIAVGSLCSLFIIVLGTIGFTIYVRYFNSYNAFYGSLATIVVFLLWSYIVMLGLVFGAIINSIYQKRLT